MTGEQKYFGVIIVLIILSAAAALSISWFSGDDVAVAKPSKIPVESWAPPGGEPFTVSITGMAWSAEANFETYRVCVDGMEYLFTEVWGGSRAMTVITTRRRCSE